MDNLTPKQQKNLERLAKIVNEGNIGVFEHLVELEDKVEEMCAEMEAKMEELKNTVEPNIKSVMEQVKGKDGETPVKGKDYFDGYTPQKGVDYEDGKDYVLTEQDKKEIAKKITVPIVEKIIEKTETIIEKPIVTENKVTIENPVTPEQVRDKLETLEGEDRLDKKAIKGLEEEFRRLEVNRGGGSAIFGGRQLRMVTFSFTGDGTTTSFTLPKDPGAKGLALWAFYQGQWLQPGFQYTLSGKILTTTFTPISGATIEGFLII